jgi:hypothetical protein
VQLLGSVAHLTKNRELTQREAEPHGRIVANPDITPTSSSVRVGGQPAGTTDHTDFSLRERIEILRSSTCGLARVRNFLERDLTHG